MGVTSIKVDEKAKTMTIVVTLDPPRLSKARQLPDGSFTQPKKLVLAGSGGIAKTDGKWSNRPLEVNLTVMTPLLPSDAEDYG